MSAWSKATRSIATSSRRCSTTGRAARDTTRSGSREGGGMRRSRRGGHSGLEFGGSGEDSFVAVVVTKLTGALLFILLLTMVIMALLPKTVSLPSSEPSGPKGKDEPAPLAIATPEALPEAIAGRPYAVALAATGGR